MKMASGKNQNRGIDVNCASQINRFMSVKIKEVIQYLESWAPLSLQEDYDNAGLLVGNEENAVSGILVSLDCTEEVVLEAISRNCNLIVAHHPIIFSGLKKLTGRSYVQRTIITAIKSDIAIYAIHTNLDNVHWGVNAQIGKWIGIDNGQILRPMTRRIWKLVTHVPKKSIEEVESALLAAGAGKIGNYDQCSFRMEGQGFFRPLENSSPRLGQIGNRESVEEVKLEVVVAEWDRVHVSRALMEAHPYEEVSHEWMILENAHQGIGAGMIGNLPQAMNIHEFMIQLKEKFGLIHFKHTELIYKTVEKIAWCGGSGDFLLEDAKAAGAQVFITSDFKYHRYFDHENKIIIFDIGHYESEKCVIELLNDELSKKFTTFAVLKTGHNTNPVQYF